MSLIHGDVKVKYIFITIITTATQSAIHRRKVTFDYTIAIKIHIYLIVLKIHFGLSNILPLRQ